MSSIDLWKLVNGDLQAVQIDPAPKTFDEAFGRLPGGAYTTFRTFATDKALGIGSHLQRLEESAQLSQVPVRVDQQEIRRGLRKAIALAGEGDHRIRILLDLEQTPGDVYLLVGPLQVPTLTDYHQGIRMVTCRMQRTNPRAKSTQFIRVSAQIRQTLPENAYEALMIDKENLMLEGLTSNFFAVVDGELWTASEGVLFGITRSLVLEVTRQLKIPVHLSGWPLERVHEIDEAFITSSSRGVLPVSQIDQRMIGTEVPGPMTRKIMAAYEEKIAGMVEPI